MGTDRGLPRAYVVVITALFALNPMIVFYGSNGMSEAPFIFFLTWAVRRLIMWMVDDDVHHLITAGGIAMGLAYLTRYDAVACSRRRRICSSASTTYLRARPPPRFRRALLDLLLVSGPGFAAFVGWAAASWLITGQAFAQFTSQYGNAAISRAVGRTQTATSATGSGLRRGVHLAAGADPDSDRGVGRPCCGGAGRTGRCCSCRSAVRRRAGFPGLQLRIRVDVSASCGSTSWRSRSRRAWRCWRFPRASSSPPTRRGSYAPPQQPPDIARRRRRGAICRWRLAFAISVPVTAWGMGQPNYAPQEYASGAVLAPDPDERQRAEGRSNTASPPPSPPSGKSPTISRVSTCRRVR